MINRLSELFRSAERRKRDSRLRELHNWMDPEGKRDLTKEKAAEVALAIVAHTDHKNEAAINELWDAVRRLGGEQLVGKVQLQVEALRAAQSQKLARTVPKGVASPMNSKIVLERTITIEPHMQAPGTEAPQDYSLSGTKPHLPTAEAVGKIIRAVEYVALSPDGRVLVTRRHYDGALLLVDVKTNEVLSSFKPPGSGWFQFTPDGKGLAVGQGRCVALYETTGWRKVQETTEVPQEFFRFAVSPDGSLLVIPYGTGVIIWSLRESSTITRLHLPDSQARSFSSFVAWSRDSRLFAVGCGKEGVVWSTRDWAQAYSWQGPVQKNFRYDVMAVEFTADGTLVAGDNLGYISVIDIRSKTVRQLSSPDDPPVFAISAPPRGSTVAVGRGNGFLELWDVAEGRRIASVRGHADSLGASKYLVCIAWFPDGRRLCTWGGYDARIWSLP